nr:YoaK family protein [Polymorphobacter sp.]
MNRFDRRSRLLAAALAAIAGYVDAIGFLTLGGFFTSFMSGNSTRLAIGIATGTSAGPLAGGLIATFVIGVVAGSYVGIRAKGRRAQLVLVFVSVLLTAAAALGQAGLTSGAIIAMVLAMGAENAVFERDGEVVGLTYMTGTLVKLGQRLTATLIGGDRFAWAPYLLLWLGLVSGAVAGAMVFPMLGLGALWLAAAATLGFAVIAARL